jgi:hypothetical protein
VDTLEDEVYGLHYTAISLTRIAVRLREQRDEALRQRDLLVAVSGLTEYLDA